MIRAIPKYFHQKYFYSLFIVFLAFITCATAAFAQDSHQIADAHLHTALDDYIARPEADFKWNIAKKSGDVTFIDLDSQRWQNEVWHHQLIVIPPKKNLYPDTAILLIDFGDKTSMLPLLQQAANLLGATLVSLDGMPAQPRWNLREDALIAYTFKQWYEGGDDTWPLLLPMTKSAVKAMDAVQQFDTNITNFVTLGGSKRGWTTWLTAAVDRRVSGIVPIVFNMLNFTEQLPHQKESFGDYSEMIRAYVAIDMPKAVRTPRGKLLEQIVDPWSYRERIIIPKLIVNSTNDPYFALDAERYYRDGLRGSTSFYNGPNAGHGANMPVQAILGSVIGWFHWLQSEQNFPRVDLLPTKSTFSFNLQTLPEAKSAVLWVAHSATSDFRTAKWNSINMQREGDYWTAEIAPAPADARYTSIFGEAQYAAPNSAFPMKLSSQIMMLDALHE